jgi:hypothetical protein
LIERHSERMKAETRRLKVEPRQAPPLANTITLGVRNVGAQRAFYLALGWPLVLDTEDFIVFELRGALLALFPVEKLAADAHADQKSDRAASGSTSSSPLTPPTKSMRWRRLFAGRAEGSRSLRPTPSSSSVATPISLIPRATTGRSRARLPTTRSWLPPAERRESRDLIQRADLCLRRDSHE